MDHSPIPPQQHLQQSPHPLFQKTVMVKSEPAVKEPPTVIYSEDWRESIEQLFSVCAGHQPAETAIDHQYSSQQRSNINYHSTGPIDNNSYVQTLQEPLNRQTKNLVSNHFKTVSLPAQSSFDKNSRSIQYRYSHQNLSQSQRDRVTHANDHEPLEPFHTLRVSINNNNHSVNNIINNPSEQIKWNMHANELQKMKHEIKTMQKRQNGLIEAGLYRPTNASGNIVFSSNVSEQYQSSFDSGLDSNDISVSSQHEPFYYPLFDRNNNHLYENQMGADNYPQQYSSQDQYFHNFVSSNDNENFNSYIPTFEPNMLNDIYVELIDGENVQRLPENQFINSTPDSEYFRMDTISGTSTTTASILPSNLSVVLNPLPISSATSTAKIESQSQSCLTNLQPPALLQQQQPNVHFFTTSIHQKNGIGPIAEGLAINRNSPASVATVGTLANLQRP